MANPAHQQPLLGGEDVLESPSSMSPTGSVPHQHLSPPPPPPPLGSSAASSGRSGIQTGFGAAIPSKPAAPPPEALIEQHWAGSSGWTAAPLPPRSPLLATRQRSVAQGLGTLADFKARDSYKEASRRSARTVFNFVRWKQHRSGRRYLRHLLGWGVQLEDHDRDDSRAAPGAFDLPSKVRMLGGPLLYVLVLSTLVAAYHGLAEAGRLPDVWPHLFLDNSAPFTLTSFALSLLLVFRTNSSYSRWLAARQAWGSVVNRTRDIARQGLAYFPPATQLQAMLCRWVIAFSHSLMCSLREEGDEAQALRHLLPLHELSALLAASHRPSFCLQVVSSVIAEAAKQAGAQQQYQQQQPSQYFAPATLQLLMDPNLTALEDAMGTCERILRTPIPLSYTRHTSRFMLAWLTLLPFTLWDACRWATPLLATTIAFLLTAIEEIGVSIEEPFSILPLCHLCGTIERNVAELQAMHSAAAAEAGAGGGSAASLVAAALQGERGQGGAGPA